MSSLFSNFDSLWKAFIRPPRQEYSISDLGPIFQTFSNNNVKRSDFDLKNCKGQTLKCSHFEIYDIKAHSILPGPCVVYLHCNSGCRIEALNCLEALISKGISLFCFDFSGCGLSEGEFVTLGSKEWEDVDTIVTYLKSQKKVKKIGLYGRSMGAVTALLYLYNLNKSNTDEEQNLTNSFFFDKKEMVSACICDSAFASLAHLTQEIVKKKTKLPNFVIKGGLSLVKSSIKKKANFDIDQVEVLSKVKKIKVPIIFVASKSDSFVHYKHTEKLYEHFGGNDKDLVFVKGGHNEIRDDNFYNQISEFFEKTLILSELEEEKKTSRKLSRKVLEESTNLTKNISNYKKPQQEVIPLKPSSNFSIDYSCDNSFSNNFTLNTSSIINTSICNLSNDMLMNLRQRSVTYDITPNNNKFDNSFLLETNGNNNNNTSNKRYDRSFTYFDNINNNEVNDNFNRNDNLYTKNLEFTKKRQYENERILNENFINNNYPDFINKEMVEKNSERVENKNYYNEKNPSCNYEKNNIYYENSMINENSNIYPNENKNKNESPIYSQKPNNSYIVNNNNSYIENNKNNYIENNINNFIEINNNNYIENNNNKEKNNNYTEKNNFYKENVITNNNSKPEKLDFYKENSNNNNNVLKENYNKINKLKEKFNRKESFANITHLKENYSKEIHQNNCLLLENPSLLKNDTEKYENDKENINKDNISKEFFKNNYIIETKETYNIIKETFIKDENKKKSPVCNANNNKNNKNVQKNTQNKNFFLSNLPYLTEENINNYKASKAKYDKNDKNEKDKKSSLTTRPNFKPNFTKNLQKMKVVNVQLKKEEKVKKK